MLYRSGTGTADALALLAEDTPDLTEKTLLEAMARTADEGLPLSEVLAGVKRFPSHVVDLVAVGERTGRTQEALESLSDYYDGQSRMSRQLRDALLYPAILLIIMLAVLAVLLVYVLPVFNDVYRQLGSSLTGVAGGLLALGRGIDAVMPVLLVLLTAAVVFIILFASSDSFRDKIISRWRASRGDQGLSWKVSLSHFTQAFAMGLSSGLSADESVELAGKLMSDIPAAKEHCDSCLKSLNEGKNLSDALTEAGLLPKSEGRLLSVAMKSGMGDSCIKEISDRMAEEGERAIQQTVSRIEPALVLAGCLLVGLILLGVMLPLMNIMSAIG